MLDRKAGRDDFYVWFGFNENLKKWDWNTGVCEWFWSAAGQSRGQHGHQRRQQRRSGLSSLYVRQWEHFQEGDFSGWVHGRRKTLFDFEWRYRIPLMRGLEMSGVGLWTRTCINRPAPVAMPDVTEMCRNKAGFSGWRTCLMALTQLWHNPCSCPTAQFAALTLRLTPSPPAGVKLFFFFFICS